MTGTRPRRAVTSEIGSQPLPAPNPGRVGSKTITDAPTAAVGASRSKYGAIPTTVNGIRFASKREAARYQALAMLERTGCISRLQCQTSWPLIVGHMKIGTYRDDFNYLDAFDQLIVEDVKGVRTPVYRLKKKLMLAIHGIEIREV